MEVVSIQCPKCGKGITIRVHLPGLSANVMWSDGEGRYSEVDADGVYWLIGSVRPPNLFQPRPTDQTEGTL